jgi:hypothetical protein
MLPAGERFLLEDRVPLGRGMTRATLTLILQNPTYLNTSSSGPLYSVQSIFSFGLHYFL